MNLPFLDILIFILLMKLVRSQEEEEGYQEDKNFQNNNGIQSISNQFYNAKNLGLLDGQDNSASELVTEQNERGKGGKVANSKDGVSPSAQSSVKVTTESVTESLENVFFPSVVVCNKNPLRRSFLRYLMNQTEDYSSNKTQRSRIWRLLLGEFILGSNSKKLQSDQDFMEEFLKLPAYQELIEDYVKNFDEPESEDEDTPKNPKIIVKHSLGDKLQTLNQIEMMPFAFPYVARQFSKGDMVVNIDIPEYVDGVLHEVGFGTDIGICDKITLNTGLVENEGQKRGCFSGINNGLKLLLDAELFDYGASSNSAGFKIAIAHQLDKPPMTMSGIGIKPGREILVALTPTIVNITANAEKLTPSERGCYREDEIELAHLPYSGGFRYSMSNCLFESVIQHVDKDCSCMPNFLSFDSNNCRGEQIKCLQKLLRQLGQSQTVTNNDKENICLSSCEDQDFEIHLSENSFPVEKSFLYTQNFCIILRKLTLTCPSRIYSGEEKIIELCNIILHILESDLLHKACPPEADHFEWSAVFNHRDESRPFEKMMFNYAHENMALVTVFIDTPFANLILRDEMDKKQH